MGDYGTRVYYCSHILESGNGRLSQTWVIPSKVFSHFLENNCSRFHTPRKVPTSRSVCISIHFAVKAISFGAIQSNITTACIIICMVFKKEKPAVMSNPNVMQTYGGWVVSTKIEKLKCEFQIEVYKEAIRVFTIDKHVRFYSLQPAAPHKSSEQWVRARCAPSNIKRGLFETDHLALIPVS